MLRPQILVIYLKYVVLAHVPHFHCNFTTMTSEFLTVLDKPGVHIKDRDNVNRVIREIVDGGANKLQVVSDFDMTITKQHENGKPHLSSFGIFARIKNLPKEYLEEEEKLSNKYRPIEVDPNIPVSVKKGLMEEWWHLSEKIMLGLKVPQADIDEIVADMGPSLRDNCVEAFNTLKALNVPVLVFSAGLGDAVVSVLKHYNVLLSNVKVISNFLKRDAEDKITGFGDKLINVFSKNELALQGTEYYDLVMERSNVILMGDSLGDAGMANGVPNCNAILKIGFLYEHVDGNLPAYMENFDIVLEDDQTMNVLNAILKLMK